ncbi:MAG: acetyl-CoA carboxylase carboxyltransferase subunit beta [Deltaproteobacteria bacterium]|nr:acetyl-CoA carboxylase carboxyltransferase subunit beta [Deltaproteobacteria bacterium]
MKIGAKEMSEVSHLRRKGRVPNGLWIKCSDCGEIIYKKELERNLHVCAKCNHHHRITAKQRIALVIDEGTFVEHDAGIEPVDALRFKDLKKYKERLAASQKALTTKDALLCGEGAIGGHTVMVAAFEFGFMGGSMGSVVGEKIARLFETGLEKGIPVIIFSSSGGARMQEGILSLMQMAKTSTAIARFKEHGLPYLSVLTDPTTGGVSASFAMLGDIILAEPKALIGFAGRRVIEQTIRQNLPDNFQTSEYLLDHGMLDMIVERKDMKGLLSRLLAFVLCGAPS